MGVQLQSIDAFSIMGIKGFIFSILLYVIEALIDELLDSYLKI